MDQPAQVSSIRESVTVGEAIDFLNQLLHIDPKALTLMILGNRVECNEELAKHQSVQVYLDESVTPTKYYVGLLGIINGMFGADKDGVGQIAALFSQEQGLVAFTRLSNTEKANGDERSVGGTADSQG